MAIAVVRLENIPSEMTTALNRRSFSADQNEPDLAPRVRSRQRIRAIAKITMVFARVGFDNDGMAPILHTPAMMWLAAAVDQCSLCHRTYREDQHGSALLLLTVIV
jgi:hypothetical protein